MPLAGPTVGHVFVKVHADGTGLDDEVERTLKGQDGAFAKGGRSNAEAYNKAWGETFRDGLNKALKDENTILKSRSNARYRLILRTGELVKSQEQLVRAQYRATIKELDDLRLAVRKVHEETHDWGDTFGRFFGKGSRNDFLNVVGSMVRGLTNLSTGFANFLGGVSETGVQLGTMIGKIGDGTSSFAKFGQALARFAGRGGGGGGVAAAGAIGIPIIIVAIYDAIGVLASGITGILGLITALASTLAFGLVGALGAVAGALVPVVFGVGVLALAIANLDEKTKKALRPVADAFEELGKAAADGFGPHLVRNVDSFVDALEGAKPVVRETADRLGKVMDGFIADIESPAFDRLRTRLSKFLPNAAETLGRAFGDLGLGLAGVFEALIPLTNRFLGWLAGISAEFANWANSAEGQQKMKKFFDDAGDSAAVLGDFIWAAVEAVTALFDAGKGTGDRLFTSIADTLDRFTAWAQTKEGKKSLEEFFAFVEEFGRELGETLVKFVELVDALDNPRTRENLLLTLEVIQKIIGAVAFLVTKLEQAIAMFDAMTDVILGPFRTIGATVRSLVGAAFKGLGGFILRQIDKVNVMKIFNFPSLGQIAKFVVGLPNAIYKAWGDADLYNIFEFPSLNKVARFIVGLGKEIKDLWGDADLMDIFDFPKLADIAAKFSGLGAMIENAIGEVAIDVVLNPIGKAAKFWDKVTAAGGVFVGAQQRIIGEAGPEAVVPLARPLSMVDPAVRELSAIAQGLKPGLDANGAMIPAPVGGREVNLTVVTPTQDPFAVATEVVNRLAAVGY